MAGENSSTTRSAVCASVVCFSSSWFTGKERDSESGNDYFGARYYASSMGRFMSPDWSDGPDTIPSAKFSNPQTLNLYSYGLNNPLRNIDPDGHDVHVCIQGGQCFDATDEQWKQLQQSAPSNVSFQLSPLGSGTISCNGSACGSAQYFERGAEDETGGDLMALIPVERIVAPIVGPALGRFGEAITGLFGRTAGRAAEDTLVPPAYANTAGGFVNWLKNLSHADTKLTSSQADAIVAQAKQLGVDVRLDPPHPGTNWDVPHLNIGREGQVHLEVPQGYSNSGIPQGSARRP